MRKLSHLFLAGLLILLVNPQMPVAQAGSTTEVISEGSATLPVIIGIKGLPVASNPFDESIAKITAKITRPDNSTISTHAFWYQEFKIQNINNQRSAVKVGEPYWRLAFSSVIAGKYSLSFDATIEEKNIPINPTTITTTYATLSKVTTRGVSFIRGDKPFVPIAYNIAWANRFEELERYDQWFSRASKSGVNVARVWMASWSLGIEWTDTGLGDYSKRLDRAWILDQVFAIAAKYNIGIDLVLINHGAFSTSTNPEWYSNPYYSSNGGPISNPAEFATNAQAWSFWERRLNYIIARYSAYPSLFTWEWWNEVNFTPISSADLTAWIAKSTAVLDSRDAYRTLRTSSWSSAASMQNWDNLDYVVTHVYDPADPIKSLGVQADVLRTAVPNKPILVGEMGSGTVTEDPFTDPTGLHLHNSQWAATFVGFAGPASYWWWDNYIDPLGFWGHTKGITVLTDGLDVASMKPSRGLSLPQTSLLTLSSQSTTLGWIRHNNFDRSAKTQQLLDAAILALKLKKKIQQTFPDPISNGGKINLSVEVDGTYNVVFLNTFTGKKISSQSITSNAKSLRLSVPKFTGDIAFRVERVIS
jgi:hypothetical protein